MILTPSPHLGAPFPNELQVLGAHRIRDPNSSVPRPETIVIRDPFKVKWGHLHDWSMKDRLVRLVIDLDSPVSIPICKPALEEKVKDFVWYLLQRDLEELVIILPTGGGMNGRGFNPEDTPLILYAAHFVIVALGSYVKGLVSVGRQPAMITIVNADAVDAGFIQHLWDNELAVRVPQPSVRGRQVSICSWIINTLCDGGEWARQEVPLRLRSFTMSEWIASKKGAQ